jgi:hypothetical protein
MHTQATPQATPQVHTVKSKISNLLTNNWLTQKLKQTKAMVAAFNDNRLENLAKTKPNLSKTRFFAPYVLGGAAFGAGTGVSIGGIIGVPPAMAILGIPLAIIFGCNGYSLAKTDYEKYRALIAKNQGDETKAPTYMPAQTAATTSPNTI